MWGGRFNKDPNYIMQKINASIDFDKKLAFHDIKGSKAHVKMLFETEIIKKDVFKKIFEGLCLIEKEILDEKFEFLSELEDIHMNVEYRLSQIIGEDAGWLHTARSRNDQVATDFKLWVRDETDTIIVDLKNLMNILIDKADKHQKIIMPGFTHLQVAQPITFSHHMLAYVEMFFRDKSRFEDGRKRMNDCPLGAAALAGTSFEINRHKTSNELGFDKPMANSLDAVSDRDFAFDFLSSSSICVSHLSRLAEEIIIWSSSQFNFITLTDAFSTGSSIMPQKKNPDAAELIRGKTGRVNGALLSILTMLKGLPLAYSKDLQEDKEQVFDTADTIKICINAMSGMIKDMIPNQENMREAAKKGFSTSTDLADFIVKKFNIPFRQAHEKVGKIVRIAEQKDLLLNELSIVDFKEVDKRFDTEIFEILDVDKSVLSKNSFGGTSQNQVKKQISHWRKLLK